MYFNKNVYLQFKSNSLCLFQTVPNCSKLFQTVLFLIISFSTTFSQTNYSGLPPQFVCGAVSTPTVRNPQRADYPEAICTDNTSIKWVRVNFHYMLRNDGTGNFNPIDDGNGNTNLNGYQRSEQLITYANNSLINNQKMWLPNPNTTPIPQTRIRYLLTGVYFHNDSHLMTAYTGAHGFPSLNDLHSAYGINTATEINYYFTRSSWINNQGGTYELSGNGLGSIGLHAGISSSYGSYLLYPNYVPSHSNLLNHEIGHILSLDHTWDSNDGCDDTPTHGYTDSLGNRRQCFKHGEYLDSCDWNNVSNNIMDYNDYNSSYTTCQVNFMHDHLNSSSGNDYVHSCSGCTPVNAFFDLSGCFKVGKIRNGFQMYSGPLYLNGQASVNEDKYKITICEVTSMGDNTCSGGYFNTGLVTGTVDKINLKSLYNFVAGKTYKVELEVASSNCFGSSTMVKFFQISTGSCNYSIP